MRVIGGQFRSRALLAPTGWKTRPTSDRLRETLMNVLENGAANRVRGAAVLDLYAGTGAVGIEALSRGAASVTFVERAADATLEANCARMGIGRETKRLRAAAADWLRRSAVPPSAQGEFELVFLDPPWEEHEEYELVLGLLGGAARGLLRQNAWVVAEHRRKHSLAREYGALQRWRVIEQGDASLSFYACREATEETEPNQ